MMHNSGASRGEDARGCLNDRHCEAPWRRSNPDFHRGGILDCFASLAMTRNDLMGLTPAGESNISLGQAENCFRSRPCRRAAWSSLRGALAPKQSRLSPRWDSGLLRFARNDEE